MNNETSLKYLNDQVQALLKKLPAEQKAWSEAKRPEQITDQTRFDALMLEKLNERCLFQTKGARPFLITDENEALLRVVFRYLNANADDNELIYRETIDGNVIETKLDLNKGLAILGNFGIGKTLLLRVIYELREFLRLNGRFVTSRDIFNCKKTEIEQLIGKEKYCLFIDDLGDEPARAMEYGQEDAPVAMILKQRLDAWENYIDSPKLFLSSNCGITKLREIYGGRIISRLYGGTNVLISRQKTDFRKK